ncbi:MAG TPA: HisA/HisF-related TIM barrel protein [Terriglobales bacterium]|jgi:phosphoribosylformimino-5-aminoimidazole carboxamide ribotide isomerase|nr:HisA/HisF-related TIM barrel protein [Terriglobales bacterium]
MLIPAIDLMEDKIVQLVQGSRKALEFTDFDYWIERFAGFPIVQLIDLDAAMNQGSNRSRIEQIARRLPCQVGGGIRNAKIAAETIALGVKKVIIGSALFQQGKINSALAQQLAEEVGQEKLLFAIDSRENKVVVHGWKQATPYTAEEAIQVLEPWCGGFLYTHVDTEGLMSGIPMEPIRNLRRATKRHLIVAGGITTQKEIDELDAMSIDAVAGMAVYTGKLQTSPPPRS